MKRDFHFIVSRFFLSNLSLLLRVSQLIDLESLFSRFFWYRHSVFSLFHLFVYSKFKSLFNPLIFVILCALRCIYLCFQNSFQLLNIRLLCLLFHACLQIPFTISWMCLNYQNLLSLLRWNILCNLKCHVEKC